MLVASTNTSTCCSLQYGAKEPRAQRSFPERSKQGTDKVQCFPEKPYLGKRSPV